MRRQRSWDDLCLQPKLKRRSSFPLYSTMEHTVTIEGRDNLGKTKFIFYYIQEKGTFMTVYFTREFFFEDILYFSTQNQDSQSVQNAGTGLRIGFRLDRTGTDQNLSSLLT